MWGPYAELHLVRAACCVLTVLIAIGVAVALAVFLWRLRQNIVSLEEFRRRNPSVIVASVSDPPPCVGFLGDRFADGLGKWQIIQQQGPNASYGDEELIRDAALLRRMSHLRELMLTAPTTSRGLEALHGLSSLERLCLHGISLSPASVDTIGECVSLRELVLGACELQDAAPLARLRTLRQLDLVNTAIDDTALAEISKCSALESLDISVAPVTDVGLEHLSALTSLKRLELYRTDIRGPGLRALAKCPSLTRLGFGGSRTTKDICRHLSTLTQLVDLRLSEPLERDEDLMHFATLPQLTRLQVNGAGWLTDEGMFYIGRLRQLQELVITGALFTDDGLKHLCSISGLRSLSLQGVTISGAGLAALSEQGKLQELRILNAPITDEGARAIAMLKSLETLHLAETSITDSGLGSLRGLQALRSIRIRVGENKGVSESGVRSLEASLPQLDAQ